MAGTGGAGGADGDERAVVGEYQAPIAGRILRAECEHDHRGAVGERLPHAQKRLRPDQRGVAEDHQYVVGHLCQRRLGSEDRMRRSTALRLLEDLSARQRLPRLGGHRLGAGTDDDGSAGAAGLCHGIEHVAQQRAMADRMQHLRPRRAHAGPLAGGEHHGETGPR